MSRPLPAINTDGDIINATTQFARLAELPEAIGFGDVATRQLRVRLAHEEFREYLDGERATIEGDGGAPPQHDVIIWGEADRVEVCDGLADQIVIAWGSLLTYVGEECGLAILREVWASNLSKVDGSLGPIVRREDGKLLKPEGWTPPDVEGVLRRHGYLDREIPDLQPVVTDDPGDTEEDWLSQGDTHGDINGGLT